MSREVEKELEGPWECSNCGKMGRQYHPCPYKEEIGPMKDWSREACEELCTCCLECEGECIDDI